MGLGWLWCALAPLCVAGVALGDICRRFTWQAWHLVTSTFVLCGRRATCGLALVARLVPCDAAPLCVAGVAWRHLPWFRVAGVALCDIYLCLVCVAGMLLMGLGWLWWRAWTPVTPRHFCVAGVALGDIYLRFVWQACCLWDWAGSGGALGPP